MNRAIFAICILTVLAIGCAPTLIEVEPKCWEESNYFCNRLCSEESGLIMTDDYFAIDSKQFDKDNDGNFSKEETRNWDFIERKYQRCFNICREDEIYPCFQ